MPVELLRLPIHDHDVGIGSDPGQTGVLRPRQVFLSHTCRVGSLPANLSLREGSRTAATAIPRTAPPLSDCDADTDRRHQDLRAALGVLFDARIDHSPNGGRRDARHRHWNGEMTDADTGTDDGPASYSRPARNPSRSSARPSRPWPRARLRRYANIRLRRILAGLRESTSMMSASARSAATYPPVLRRRQVRRQASSVPGLTVTLCVAPRRGSSSSAPARISQASGSSSATIPTSESGRTVPGPRTPSSSARSSGLRGLSCEERRDKSHRRRGRRRPERRRRGLARPPPPRRRPGNLGGSRSQEPITTTQKPQWIQQLLWIFRSEHVRNDQERAGRSRNGWQCGWQSRAGIGQPATPLTLHVYPPTGHAGSHAL